jgi:hypothetical protein
LILKETSLEKLQVESFETFMHLLFPNSDEEYLGPPQLGDQIIPSEKYKRSIMTDNLTEDFVGMEIYSRSIHFIGTNVRYTNNKCSIFSIDRVYLNDLKKLREDF